MASEAYLKLLRDPRWQKRRLEIFQRDNWTCQGCYDTASTLNVHHRWYRKGAQPWEYEDDALVTFCEKCHETTTKLLPEVIDQLRYLAPNGLTWILGAISGVRVALRQFPVGDLTVLDNGFPLASVARELMWEPEELYPFVTEGRLDLDAVVTELERRDRERDEKHKAEQKP